MVCQGWSDDAYVGIFEMQNQTTQVTCTWCGRKMVLNPGSFPICSLCTDSVIGGLPRDPGTSGADNTVRDAAPRLQLPDGLSTKG